jgi:hypothetical protein
MSKFSVSVCKWKILENDLRCFTLTLRSGKAQLQVNEYGVGSWDFILHSSMKFLLCFHLQTGSGDHPLYSSLGTLPGGWNTRKMKVIFTLQRTCAEFQEQCHFRDTAHWDLQIATATYTTICKPSCSFSSFRLLQQYTQSGAQLINHVSYVVSPVTYNCSLQLHISMYFCHNVYFTNIHQFQRCNWDK